MDKKAWIVVTICVILLGLNVWYDVDSKTQQPAPKEPIATQSAEQPAEARQPASQTVTEQPAAGQVDMQLPQTPAQAAPAQAVLPKPQEIATLTAKNAEGKEVARYSFQDIGGSISHVTMLGQSINSTKEGLKQEVEINGCAPQGVGTLMFGLNGDLAPRFDQTTYRLLPEQSNDKQVTLLGRMGDLLIRKTFSLKPVKDGDAALPEGNAYVLEMQMDVQNTGDIPLAVRNWGVYTGAVNQISKNEGPAFVNYVVQDDGDFSKYGSSDFSHFFSGSERFRNVTNCDKLEWVGLMNQYYASVLKPDAASLANSYYAAPIKLNLQAEDKQVDGVEVALGMPDFDLNGKSKGRPGEFRTLKYEYFAGPKLNTMLSGMTDDFRKIDRVMDYGLFYVISYPMNWLINVLHDLFGNWGWAIVAMTFVVRALIWPLYRKSYISMKRMSLLQPKMQELKEKYPDDQQKVQMEMMNLYREYGINPMGGCLPMLLQMPIFLSFFYVLQTAAELRGATWIGWVQDLSLPDTVFEIALPFALPFLGDTLPINVLPFLMIISMIVMMGMTPQTGGDKMQRNIMRIMPLFFFLFCYNYASALALYWTTTNIISMIQTLIIRRMPMPELKKVDRNGKGGKKSFMQRMMDAQQAALKEQQRQAQMRNVTRR